MYYYVDVVVNQQDVVMWVENFGNGGIVGCQVNQWFVVFCFGDVFDSFVLNLGLSGYVIFLIY